MVILLYVMLLLKPSAADLDGDSPSPMVEKRIVGGVQVSISDFAYQVSVTIIGSHVCGGSIIRPNWVLTAGHCCPPTLAPRLMNVRVGSNFRGSGGTIYKVAEMKIHPKYNNFTADYDFCLLRISGQIAFTTNVQEIPMFDRDEEIEPGSFGIVTGYGYLSERSAASTNLQMIVIPIWDPPSCKAVLKALITDQMMCAGYVNGTKDSCQGDSGGPCAVDGRLAAVVSWGFGCARPKYPGVYAKVSKARPWIDSLINHSASSKPTSAAAAVVSRKEPQANIMGSKRAEPTEFGTDLNNTTITPTASSEPGKESNTNNNTNNQHSTSTNSTSIQSVQSTNSSVVINNRSMANDDNLVESSVKNNVECQMKKEKKLTTIFTNNSKIKMAIFKILRKFIDKKYS